MNSNLQPSSQVIQSTLSKNGFDADCYVEYEPYRCHIYSLPFTLNCIHWLTSRFPGGTFINVQTLSVFDLHHPFKPDFFAKISSSFPVLTKLKVWNNIEQLEKQSSSIIEFTHLSQLDIDHAHIDYVEQFLSNSNTYLPALNSLQVKYTDLAIVTNNFTRSETQINCSKLKTLFLEKQIYLPHSKDFYQYFPQEIKISFV